MGNLFSCCLDQDVDGLAPLKEPLTSDAPCSTYRVNMSAEEFGECVCGFPKVQHEAVAFACHVPTAQKKTAQKKKFDETVLVEQMTHHDKTTCRLYEPNLKAASFGECKCGRPRSEHSDAALKAGALHSSKAKPDEAALVESMTHRDKADCLKYQPNLQAASFGECVCGRPHADHTEAALKAGAHFVSQKKLDEVALREKMTRRELTDCAAYRPNLEAKAFGECVCGQPRAAHTDAALKAGVGHGTTKKLDEAALRQQMEARRDKATGADDE